jgi:hypothetical protein
MATALGQRPSRRTPDLAPTLTLAAGAALLLISLFLPFWEMRWTKPVDSSVVGFLDHVEGPVDSLPEPGAPPELRRPPASPARRAATLAVIGSLSLLVVAAAFVRNRWAAVLSLPSLMFPLLALADVACWQLPILEGMLSTEGVADTELPRFLFGDVAVGDATFLTRPRAGLLVYLAAVAFVIVGLFLHRRAYKPSRTPTSSIAR